MQNNGKKYTDFINIIMRQKFKYYTGRTGDFLPFRQIQRPPKNLPIVKLFSN